MDVLNLLETEYKPEYPELLSMYYVDIEFDGGEVWHGKVWEETDDTTFPMTGMGNSGEGAPNYYNAIVFDRFRVFKERCYKCFPTKLDPMDFACMYIELREAKKELESA